MKFSSLLLVLFVATTLCVVSATTTTTPKQQHTFTLGKWIAAPAAHSTTNFYFRTSAFTMPDSFFESSSSSNNNTADFFWSGIGNSELWCNGRRVLAPGDSISNGAPFDERMAPGTTTFHHRAFYIRYDLRPYLKPDDNVIAVTLGNGWLGMKRAFNMQPRLRAELVVDGQVVVHTHAGYENNTISWYNAAGALQRNSIYFGEQRDANLEIPKWSETNFPTQYACSPKTRVTWFQCQELSDYNNVKMAPRLFPGMRVLNTISPQNHYFLDGNKTLVVDFGVEVSGGVRMRVKASSPGGELWARQGEVLDHYNPLAPRQVYFANLRSAQDRFVVRLSDCETADGSARFEFTERFSYAGFRFLQINATDNIDLGFVAHNIMFEQVGTPIQGNVTVLPHNSYDDGASSSSSSSAATILSDIRMRALGTIQNNAQSYMSDCPQRDERLGWSADWYLSLDAAFTLFDTDVLTPFTVNHLQTLSEDELFAPGVGGEVPDVSPFVRYGRQLGDPSWGQVYPELAHTVYAETLDDSLIQQHWSGLVGWMTALHTKLASTGFSSMFAYYGDWVPPPPAAKINNHYSSSFALMYTAATLMRDLSIATNNASYFEHLTNTLQQKYYPEFLAAWYDEKTATFGGADLQASYVFALSLPGLFERSGAQPAVLLSYIDDANGHFTTGILSQRLLFERVANTLGRTDVALEMLLKTDYPSYAYQWLNDVETPTTYNMWEVWDAPFQGPGMDSRSHHMLGSVATFIQQQIGGVVSSSSALRSLNTDALSFEQLRQLHNEYGNYNTLLLDLSAPSFNTPLREWKSQRRRLSNGVAVDLSWRRVGGQQQIMCSSWLLRDVQQKPQQQQLTCGADGGVITEVVDVFFGHPAGSCATLRHNPTDSASALLHDERRAGALLAAKCAGLSACPIGRLFEDLFPRTAPSTTNIYVRARCSAPLKIVADIRITKNNNADAAHPVEIFVPTFGFKSPALSIVGESNSSSLKQMSARSHPMLSAVSRGRHARAFSLLRLVAGNLAGSVTVTVAETSVLQRAPKASHRSQSVTEIVMSPTCKPVALNIFDADTLSPSCRALISPSRLVDAIETQCISEKTKNNCVVSVESVARRARTKTLPASCVFEVEQAVDIVC